MSPGTIDAYLAAVFRLNRELGWTSGRAKMFDLAETLKGIKNVVSGRTEVPRRPITCAVLKRGKGVLDLNNRDQTMVWAALTMGTLGLLRGGEFALDEREPVSSPKLLRVGSIRFERVNGTRVVRVLLKNSKTDRQGRGVTVTIGQTGSDVCAVAAMDAYLQHREGAGPNEALFVFSDGVVFRRGQLTKFIRVLMSKIGEDPTSYSGHSCRIGGATDLAAKGVPDHEIQSAGRWASDAFKRYVRFRDAQSAARAAIMAG